MKTYDELALTVQSIKDYQVCALLYDYRHKQKLSEPVYGRELAAQRFELTLRKVISFFFYKKQAGITPSYNALVNRWEKLWFPKDMTAYDLALEQHETWHGNTSSYATSGTVSLMQFHESFYNDPSLPILINENFTVPIGKTVRLAGHIDLVLRHDDLYRVFILSTKSKRPTMGSLLLDFAALKYAFEYRNDTPRRAEYYLYDVASAKPGLFRASPSSQDVRALFYWATQAAHADVYAPRRGLTAHCRGCAFDEMCAEWSEWPTLEEIEAQTYGS